MIKLRDKEGKSESIESSASFVEICDLEGNPALVFYMPEPGAISTISGDSQEGEIYSNKYNVSFSKVIDLEDRYKDDRQS